MTKTALKLRKNKNFLPCTADEGDELFRNGIFVFNISKMRDYLESGEASIPITEVDVDQFYASDSSINESHLDSVDLKNPIIIAEIAPGRYNVIDGNHRMEKARKMGIFRLPCYQVEIREYLRFLISKKAYVTYVEYWNGKLE